jgi:hypothetical protein
MGQYGQNINPQMRGGHNSNQFMNPLNQRNHNNMPPYLNGRNSYGGNFPVKNNSQQQPGLFGRQDPPGKENFGNPISGSRTRQDTAFNPKASLNNNVFPRDTSP